MHIYSREEIQKELEKLDEYIDEFELRLTALGKEKQEEYKKDLKNLKVHRDMLRGKWDNLAGDVSSTWENVKDSMAEGVDRVKGMYEKLKKKF